MTGLFSANVEPAMGNLDKPKNDFEQESQSRPPSMIAEFADFLIHNKKWWLTPIVLVLLFLSLFILLTNTAIGPFIYVFF